MKIEYASELAFQYILDNDKHISKELLNTKIKTKEIIIVRNHDNKNIGWLRYGYFWDNTPFMNMLYIDENYRNNGIGKDLINFWENEMKNKGYKLVMTSTLSNENSQHFYRKLEYKDAGSLLLEDEPLEIIFTKKI
ncbi:GNAT family N-acetyltransferase [Clostridium sardiniense]|uniref:GNAT family N-acetyltransferase n=1 Tax=Clostridium sardiniense TaxID=29369 RepID=A0ABS7KT88_CLOSR|nr:GNAT family N-acetyltransferase [Clostridium sardiniense]MBY0754030.1 GNAT family N-acetyltransferase [Clostridium sardiniense]MDQ0459453.1 ribosomal protein S18 acetylase RimI-like enzyme [Clostridium sardiniense]